jgi:F-type H+-transporting ATPase subunit b
VLIDWFTVGAQIVNFLILAWLMKHFLYHPVLAAIDAREKHLADEQAAADAKMAAAKKSCDDHDAKNQAFDEQKAALWTAATTKAQAEGDRLMGEARKEGETLRGKQAEGLRQERAQLGDDLAQFAKTEVFEIARKALMDLATVSLEERLGEVFTRRLRELDGSTKTALAMALDSEAEPATVTSAFALPADQRAAIQNALNETFHADIRLRFETAPGVVSGIELSARGQKLTWSIAEYLADLEHKCDALTAAPMLSR